MFAVGAQLEPLSTIRVVNGGLAEPGVSVSVLDVNGLPIAGVGDQTTDGKGEVPVAIPRGIKTVTVDLYKEKFVSKRVSNLATSEPVHELEIRAVTMSWPSFTNGLVYGRMMPMSSRQIICSPLLPSAPATVRVEQVPRVYYSRYDECPPEVRLEQHCGSCY